MLKQKSSIYMKVLILAAGLGTRLKPLTNKIPKVMVKIGGKPLLCYHIQLLKKHGICDIWINLHWFPEKITNYFGDGSKFGVKINYSFEKKLLGTAGALKNPHSGIEKEFKKEKFLIVYGDNFTNLDYSKLRELHKLKKPLMTIGLYKSDVPWTKGVVETDHDGKVLKIVEKPPKNKITTNHVNAGIYLCETEIFDFIPQGFSDFGYDIFPKILAKKRSIYALPPNYYFQDVGSLEWLKKARRDVKKIAL